MTIRRKITVALVFSAFFVGLTGLAVDSGSKAAVEVRAETVARRDLASVVTANGKVEPRSRVDISADLSGRVVHLAVREGQWVNRGDLLLRLDPSSYEAAVRRAEAAVAQAQAQAAQARANLLQVESAARRMEEIGQDSDLIARAELEQARTQALVAQAQYGSASYSISQAQAVLSEARGALRKTVIAAPMSGLVTRLRIAEGEMAVMGTMNNPGSLLLTIADPSVMEARVRVDEADVPRISTGDSATVWIDAFPGQPFAGRVAQIANSALAVPYGPAAEQQSSRYEVVITLAGGRGELRPDLSASAEIVVASRKKALAAPILALTLRDAPGRGGAKATGGAPSPRKERREGVFVIRDGKARFVPVQTGIVGDQHFEVKSGLREGDVVVSGSYETVRQLEDGARIRIAAPAAQPGGR